MNKAFDSMIWVDKYRPREFNDLIAPEDFLISLKKYEIRQEIPHLLFFGPPGGGKTTTARLLVDKLIKNTVENLLAFNGSSKKTKGIDFTERIIIPFCRLPPAGKDKVKIIFIDECDQLTQAAFDALRNPIETYTKTTRFLMTCNYISKIPDAIQSRTNPFEFKQMEKEFVVSYCEKILKNEKIEFSDDDLLYIIDQFYPDIRKTVNCLERNSDTGKLVLKRDQVFSIENTIFTTVIEIVQSVYPVFNRNGLNSKFSKVMKICLESPLIDFSNIYTKLFYSEYVPPPAKLIVNKYSTNHLTAFDPKMNFTAMVVDIARSLKDFKEKER